MSDIIRSLIPGFDPPTDDGYKGPVEGRVLRDVSTETEAIYFTIPSFDDEQHEWGPAPWQTRTLEYTQPDGIVTRHIYPMAGDRVLVFFPDGTTDNPWCIWWPVGRGYEETRI